MKMEHKLNLSIYDYIIILKLGRDYNQKVGSSVED